MAAQGGTGCAPRAVIAFGSAARGEMTEASDVDIALVSPDAKSLKNGRAAIYRQEPPDSWPLDLLFALIMGEGRILYGSLE